jgi:uncharacterized protein (UPF0332 family)
LRLAKGFLATAVIRDDSSEFEMRNALSRCYYGLFHVCHAWLAMKNVPLSRRKHRQPLFDEILSKRGKEFSDRLEAFWLLRKKADYDEPAFFQPGIFQDDLNKLRLSARGDRGRMEAEFDSYATEAESFLAS